jgi:HlyD family secretion protein
LAISLFHRRILALAVITATGGAGFLAFGAQRTGVKAQLIPGVVRETEIHIAPEISGRLVSVFVKAGQPVKKGDFLALLSNPELSASVMESTSDLAKTRADRDNVFAGVRKEVVNISAQDIRIAESKLVLAKRQYERTAALAADAFASKQALDERTATFRAAEANLAQLRAVYNQNTAGPTKEERESAQAKVVLADAALADLEAKFAKTKLFAPADGVIGTLAAEPGEVISPGQSVMTLAAGGERWFTFTVREDFLKGVTVGSPVRLLTANGKTVEARVTELRPLGEFATWRAARAVGDYDLNSFLVRADPDKTTEELHPGMTVWLEPSAQASTK